MTFDELQRTWQSQESGFRISIDSEMLLREIRRNKKHFKAAVFWRDVREIGIAFPLSIFFLYHGLKSDMWSLLLLGLLIAGVGLFMIVDRVIQKRRSPELAGTLVGCIASALAQIEHQIWLLRNVFWWYLLPVGIGLAVFTGHLAWLMRDFPAKNLISHLIFALSWVLLILGVYLLNQYAVRKGLRPRQRELEQLLDSLRNASP